MQQVQPVGTEHTEERMLYVDVRCLGRSQIMVSWYYYSHKLDEFISVTGALLLSAYQD